MSQPPTTRESIIETWKAEDKKSKNPMGVPQLARAMGIKAYWIWKLFAGGSLTDLKRQHGIRLSKQERHLTPEALCAELDAVATKRGRMPAWSVLIRHTGISEKTWKKNLGGREGCAKEDVYRAYQKWLLANNPTSPNVALVARLLDGPPTLLDMPDIGTGTTRSRTVGGMKVVGPVYGGPLHFGNLTYAPTNELGVVFLFGMVSKALGFESIERIGPDFPDCEALRRVPGGQLQRKRIEFEYRSREFNHDPQGLRAHRLLGKQLEGVPGVA